MPMLVHPSASVSRDAGTGDWVSATDAISVGATASPLSSSRPATATGWSTNSSGTTDAASSTAPIRNRRAGLRLPMDRAGDQARDQRAGGPDHQDRARVRQDAVLAGERDHDDLHPAEERAEGGAGDHDRHQEAERQPARGPLRSGGTRGVSGGSVPRCTASISAPTRPSTTTTPSANAGWSVVARNVTSTGPDDEDHLVEHGLEGVRGVQQRRIGIQQPVRPARPDRRSGRGGAESG